jgi:hypothetical protein
MTVSPPTASSPRAAPLHPREAWLPSLVVGLLALDGLVHTSDVREVGGNPAASWWIAAIAAALIALAAGHRAACPDHQVSGDA